MDNDKVIVRKAVLSDCKYAAIITAEMEASARARGTGISKRSVNAIMKKIREGKAVIALTVSKIWVGFSYIESWSDGTFVSNSGMIVNPAFRGLGVASRIKKRIFRLSREKYPEAKVFSITSGLTIMRMNSKLGFLPVTFNEITRDPEFWKGCKSCVNFNILQKKGCQHCLCTAMLYTPPGVETEN
ncbi:N-acetyltransferase [Chitinophaga rhizophila]|uniref:N-acetyltransferase n=1 Tax=Chitinophaga rhizophila TaxID=2866212 RepID=A0ABS7GKM2_9BACT|nr:N-acetyltransferase [Chitinophaga rhizophila]MBW8688263.1 N-acetyltransferase [Chitinophaga rhizophila]